MARTPSLNAIADQYQKRVDDLIRNWRAQNAQRTALGAATMKGAAVATISGVATNWEFFRSEWHKAAIARDATNYRSDLVRRLLARASETESGKLLVQSIRGQGLTIDLNLPKHPTIAVVNALRDARDRNVSFRSKRESDDSAQRELASQYANKVRSLSTTDWTMIELMIAVRNAQAHSSRSSIDAMNTAIRAAANGAPLVRPLGRNVNRVTASGIGSYLDARITWQGNAEHRVIAIGSYIRDLADKFRI